jgi:hypothetical protein
MAAMVCFLIAAWGLFKSQGCCMHYAIYGSIFSMVAILPWIITVVQGALCGGTAADVALLIFLLSPIKDPFLHFLK